MIDPGGLDPNPELDSFIYDPDPEHCLLLQVLREQQEARREREQLRIRMMNADPFDLEAQRLIAKVRFKIFFNFLPS